jgi:hypothetical protein
MQELRQRTSKEISLPGSGLIDQRQHVKLSPKAQYDGEDADEEPSSWKQPGEAAS